MADKCPVDHGSHSSDESCPVDHKSRTTWSSILPGSSSAHPVNASSLSTEREVSSIPRTDNGNWVYPSEAQFFAAMARKNHNPHAPDMKTIIPIHNAVNERAWSELMKWESGRGGEKCGGVKLVNFKGRPNDLTPKARLMTLLGYSAPFDRHDWVVERCGTRIRYVIDFYTGRGAGPSSSNNVSFYLDVRPALDNWEGVKMRAENIWQDWFGSVHSSSTPSQS
ncbi:cytochrome c/c1 heme-lyase [Suillus clintonianus]|uniref:cytochrome c/c1 heme-lyase n=1 Tax=Suillus clintonianus TaxID=1904413 RepID=UPI001B8859DD|nr:cytochrome c/c1 heme-lyase [Suillus clintonianus]KAG2149341.1 cytochrome c/c1 heme-lyase [Suillus clintonianus]